MAVKKKATKRKTKKSKSVNDQWIEGIATSESESMPYSVKNRYEVGDLIDHSSFGRGVVKSFIDNKKIEVVFEESIKTLIHGIA